MDNVQNNVELPRHVKQLPDRLKIVLGKFYDGCSTKQWFRRAEIIENHPLHMKAAIEIYCNYNPVLEMKEILQFAEANGLGVQIIDASHSN